MLWLTIRAAAFSERISQTLRSLFEVHETGENCWDSSSGSGTNRSELSDVNNLEALLTITLDQIMLENSFVDCQKQRLKIAYSFANG